MFRSILPALLSLAITATLALAFSSVVAADESGSEGRQSASSAASGEGYSPSNVPGRVGRTPAPRATPSPPARNNPTPPRATPAPGGSGNPGAPRTPAPRAPAPRATPAPSPRAPAPRATPTPVQRPGTPARPTPGAPTTPPRPGVPAPGQPTRPAPGPVALVPVPPNPGAPVFLALERASGKIVSAIAEDGRAVTVTVNTTTKITQGAKRATFNQILEGSRMTCTGSWSNSTRTEYLAKSIDFTPGAVSLSTGLVNSADAFGSLNIHRANGSALALTLENNSRVFRNGLYSDILSLKPADLVEVISFTPSRQTPTVFAVKATSPNTAGTFVQGRISVITSTSVTILPAASGAARSFAIHPFTVVSRNGQPATIASLARGDDVEGWHYQLPGSTGLPILLSVQAFPNSTPLPGDVVSPPSPPPAPEPPPPAPTPAPTVDAPPPPPGGGGAPGDPPILSEIRGSVIGKTVHEWGVVFRLQRGDRQNDYISGYNITRVTRNGSVGTLDLLTANDRVVAYVAYITNSNLPAGVPTHPTGGYWVLIDVLVLAR